VLNRITAPDTATAITRTITLGTGGTLSINGVQGTSLGAMRENTIMVRRDDVEVWDVVNATDSSFHSFHLHDVPFQVLRIGGQAPS
jgi:FtsP/CotA-like multicopper oxidase with cupredoxin domain